VLNFENREPLIKSTGMLYDSWLLEICVKLLCTMVRFLLRRGIT